MSKIKGTWILQDGYYDNFDFSMIEEWTHVWTPRTTDGYYYSIRVEMDRYDVYGECYISKYISPTGNSSDFVSQVTTTGHTWDFGTEWQEIDPIALEWLLANCPTTQGEYQLDIPTDENTPTEDNTLTRAEKLAQIAENEQRIYDTGYSEGYSEGWSESDVGIEQGKQAEQDRFWETLQQGGNLKNYNYLFYSTRFNDTIYNPKYPIILGVTSTAGNVNAFGGNRGITDTKVPIIAEGTYINQVFSDARIKIIRELRVNENTTYNHVFDYLSSLEELTITGTIGKNGFDVSPCTKLSKASMTSIINALKSGVSGLTCTLGTENLAKLTDAEKAIATEKGWSLA